MTRGLDRTGKQMFRVSKISEGTYCVRYLPTVASLGLSRVPAGKSVARGPGTLVLC